MECNLGFWGQLIRCKSTVSAAKNCQCLPSFPQNVANVAFSESVKKHPAEYNNLYISSRATMIFNMCLLTPEASLATAPSCNALI